jgi:CBS domain containing-hemolysin-like protein
LSFFAIPVKYLVYYPLLPLTYVLETTSKFFMKLFLRREIEESKHEFSSIDLEYLIKEVYSQDHMSENKSADIDTEIFEKALYLKDVKVRECMVHRMNVKAIASTATIDELKQRFIETQHSRLIVHNGNIDDIVGYIHHQELLKDPNDIASIIRSLPAIPETMSARDLLLYFYSRA